MIDLELYEKLTLWLLWSTAPAATLFPLIYGFSGPWWRSLIGRALLVKSTAVALLVDLSLILREVELTILESQVLGLVLLGLIFVGVNLQFAALVHEKVKARE